MGQHRGQDRHCDVVLLNSAVPRLFSNWQKIIFWHPPYKVFFSNSHDRNNHGQKRSAVNIFIVLNSVCVCLVASWTPPCGVAPKASHPQPLLFIYHYSRVYETPRRDPCHIHHSSKYETSQLHKSKNCPDINFRGKTVFLEASRSSFSPPSEICSDEKAESVLLLGFLIRGSYDERKQEHFLQIRGYNFTAFPLF